METNKAEIKHYRITIKGEVQRTHFRAATKGVADLLKIRGTIQNLPDGSVQIEAEGPAAPLEQFLQWCHEGTDRAKVEEVLTEEGAIETPINFTILK